MKEQGDFKTREHRQWLISCRNNAQEIVDKINEILIYGYPEKESKKPLKPEK